MKKDKNSLLNIHYSRTLTSDNLSNAANYVGEYFLKGLGTLGRFLNSGFTSPTYGTTGQVSYARNAEDAKKLRELSEASEQAMGKAMTWVSPLNYGVALATGNGLDARKGEEEVASWSPAWLAAARLGELYVGPKGVKATKAAPKTVVNVAAKAGSKAAKKAVITREIKLGIKLNTKNGRIEVTENYFNSPDKWYRITETPEKYGIMELGKNVTTHDASQTYGTINGWRSSMLRAPITKSSEGFIKRPHKIEVNVRRKNGQAHGNTSQAAKGKLWGGTTSGSNLFPEGIIEGQAPSMINYGLDRTNFVITPWELVPNGGRVGFHTGEMPMSNLGWFQRTNKGTYTYETIIPEKRIPYQPKLLLDSPTSLKFFERKPARISEAERLGIPKGDRGNLSLNLKLALLDLALYKSSGQYRQVFRVTPDWENFGWNLDRSNPTFMLLFAKDGKGMRGPWARVMIQSPTGKGVLAVNPERNMAGYTSRSFPVPEGMNWAPGEANMMIEGTNGLKLILTAPRTDFFDGVGVESNIQQIGSSLPNTIDKNIMKDFWINSRKAQRPGTYLSGDNGHAPLGSTLIEAFKKKQLHKTPLLERPIDLQFIRRTGVSPDSYSSIIRQGNRDGSLRWGEGFTKWNNSAIKNKNIYDAYLQLMEGKISPEQYEGIFNRWSLEIGGRPLLWTTIGELKIPVHPHPYIYAKKQGGKMNILEFLKNGSGIHIKEKNKGSFTRWCGGNVTEECIRRGKASSNPKIRKKATFALNSRRWKHEDGGEIKYFDPLRRIIKKHLTGGKTTFGLTIVNGALSLIKTSTDNKKIQADIEAQKAQNLADWALIMKLIIKLNQLERNQLYLLWVNDYLSGRTMDQPSLIVAQHTNYELLNQELAEGKQELTNKNNQLDVQANAETSSNWGNAIGGILLSGLGVVGDYLSSKGTTTPATTGSSVYKVDSFWKNPTLKTSTPTYSFNTPTLTPPKTNYNFLK